MSPYPVTVLEVVQRFGNSRKRVEILAGLLDLREALRSVGFGSGFQWLDGSFMEDVERIRGRDPGDIDVVSWLNPPAALLSAPDPALIAVLTNDTATKNRFHVHHFPVRLDNLPHHLVLASRFYFGLFSHQRDTAIWKGLLQINFAPASDDVAARQILNTFSSP